MNDIPSFDDIDDQFCILGYLLLYKSDSIKE